MTLKNFILEGDKNIDPTYYQRLAQVESGGNPNAEASTSSASGMYQFTAGTWDALVKDMKLDYSLDDRFDPVKAHKVVEEFTKRNSNYLSRNLGRAPNEGELYLAHFAGMGGAKRMLEKLKEDPNTSVKEVFGVDAIASNKNVFRNKDGSLKTVRDVYNWAADKFGSKRVADKNTSKTVTTKAPVEQRVEQVIDNTRTVRNRVEGDFKNYEAPTIPEENKVSREEVLQFDKLKAIDEQRALREKEIIDRIQAPVQGRQQPVEQQNLLQDPFAFDPYNYIKLEELQKGTGPFGFQKNYGVNGPQTSQDAGYIPPVEEKKPIPNTSGINFPSFKLKEDNNIDERLSIITQKDNTAFSNNTREDLIKEAGPKSELYKRPEVSLEDTLNKREGSTTSTGFINLNNSNNGKYIQVGDSGDSIKGIQQFLINEGYLEKENKNGNSNLDGKFGGLTDKALREYQKKSGLKVDGKFGKNTLSAMEEDSKNKFSVKDERGLAVNKSSNAGPKKIRDIGVIHKNNVESTTPSDNRDDRVVTRIKNSVPLSIRQYVHDTFGGEEPITEKNLNDEEYTTLRQAVENSLKNKKQKLDYDSWREVGSGGKDTREDDMNLFNPASSLQKTLGQASIKVDEKGDIYVIDRYNFNDAGDKKNRYKNQYTDENGLMPLTEATSFSNALYRVARNYKTVNGKSEGGSPVRIYAGNIKEYGINP